MANDALRQLARAVFGRMRGVLSQTVRAEAERMVRHVRERMKHPGALEARPLMPPAEPGAGTAPQAETAPPAVPTPNTSPATAASAEPARSPVRPPEPAPMRAAAKTASGELRKKSKPAPTAKPAPDGPVNVNVASRDELMALPGIGEARADAIIKARPFTDVAALQERKILPAGVFAALKDRITAA